MQITEDFSTIAYPISSYTAHSITINHQTYRQSLIVSPETLIPEWELASIKELQVANLQALLELNPEIILIGTGQYFTMPTPEQWLPALEGKPIGIEWMSTSSAIRTYSALSAENRQVVAGLIFEKVE